MNDLIEQQREHFNDISEKYFQARKDPNHLLLKDLIWTEFFRRNGNRISGIKRVLEPMCGMAEGYEILSGNLHTDFKYLGFDYSENMVKIARRQHPSLPLEVGDVTSYRAAEESFDLIILIGGLHHVYSRARDVIRNLATSLEPGGFFLSYEPTHNVWFTRNARKRVYQTNDFFDNDTEQGFEYYDLDRHFKDAGFEKVDEVYPGLLAYVLYYNPDAFPALNVGGLRSVRTVFALEKLFWANWIGRKFSFATMTLWRKK